MNPAATRQPSIGQIVRSNVVTISIFALGSLGGLVMVGRVLERIDVIEKAQAATSAKVEAIDKDTRAAIGRTDRNLAVMCQALKVDCERPAPGP
jgi:hypothetical protein